MALFDNSSFDPQSFSGAMPGWLQQALQSGLLGRSLGEQTPMQPQTGPTFAQGDSGSMGGVPFPIFGQAPVSQTAALPTNAQPTQYQQQPAQSAPQQQLPTALQAPAGGNIGAAFQGFVNANSPMQAIGNLVSGLATGQRTDPAGMAQQSAQATYQALRQAGVPDGVAQAAALNPEVLKTIAPQIYTKPKFEKIKGALGDEQPVFVDEGRQTINGQPISGGASTPSATALAPGVKQVDSSLTGDAYLAQFSPEVQSAVKAYINGDVLPSGNPRQAGIAQFAKTVAQKYGQDTGTPVSDSLYSQKRVYRSQLGSNQPNSAGGQAKAFNQGIEHMAALADTLEGLDNSKGLGIPIIAEGINAARQFVSNDQSAISDKAKGIGQTLAGEVGKLFSGTAGGGVHERSLTMERFSTVKSPAQLAAALEATLEVMRGGLTALEQRRDEVLGTNSDVKFVSEETKKKITHIEDVIQRLKTGQSPQAASSSAPQTATGPDGKKLMLQGNQWVPMK